MSGLLTYRSIAVMMAMAMACDADFETSEPVAISKISPSEISSSEAWRLFDRSIGSRFTPGDELITITLERAATLRALKVFGPAPYRITVRGQGSRSLGFDPLDMSALTSGWHVIASHAPAVSDHVELRFEAVGAGGGVPELELWAEDQTGGAARVPARTIDLTAPELPSGFVRFASESMSEPLSPGDCADFVVEIDRSPALFRRAHLLYDARGLFRSFAVVRSIGGLGQQGGQWLPADRHPIQTTKAVVNAAIDSVSACVGGGGNAEACGRLTANVAAAVAGGAAAHASKTALITKARNVLNVAENAVPDAAPPSGTFRQLMPDELKQASGGAGGGSRGGTGRGTGRGGRSRGPGDHMSEDATLDDALEQLDGLTRAQQVLSGGPVEEIRSRLIDGHRAERRGPGALNEVSDQNGQDVWSGCSAFRRRATYARWSSR